MEYFGTIFRASSNFSVKGLDCCASDGQRCLVLLLKPVFDFCGAKSKDLLKERNFTGQILTFSLNHFCQTKSSTDVLLNQSEASSSELVSSLSVF